MRLAVIADVHANAVALEAVLASIRRENVDRLLCLGDLVGYNAQPSEVVASVSDAADVIVAGNHDLDVLADDPLPGTNTDARYAQEWTRRQLDEAECRLLSSLPRLWVDEQGFVAVHGCYLNDRYYLGYVTTTMLEKNLRAVARNTAWPVLAFCAHTHAPMFGSLTGDAIVESRLDEPGAWNESAEAVIVNPGSVGQPRDGDLRASFAIVDLGERTVAAHRVAYDVEAASNLVRGAGLPVSLADRLLEGR